MRAKRNESRGAYDYWLDRKKEFGRTYLLRIRVDRNMVVRYLYPFSVHIVTFNFITNLMHLFN